MKSVAFYFPYYELSGCPVLFLNLAEYIARNHKEYEVYVVDFVDGYMAQNRSDKEMVKLIPFHKGKECVVDTDYLVMQAILPSAMRPELTIADNVKVLQWVLHPMNFFPSVFPLNFFRNYFENNLDTYRSVLNKYYAKEIKNTQLLISCLHKGNSLCFNSSGYVPTTESLLGESIGEYTLVQNASSDSTIRKESFDLSDEIHMSWVGRLCDFKIYILNYTLERLKRYAEESKKKIVFHVIGDGELESLLFNKESEWFTIIKEGTISKNELDSFMVNNSSLNFAMGVSAIESAKLGIATIVLDATYQEVKGDYMFHWFYTNEDFDTGHMITESDFEEGNKSLETMLASFLLSPKEYSDRSFKYYEDNYSLKIVVGKLLNCLEGITLKWGDLPQIVKRKSLSRKVYNMLKYSKA